MSVAGVEEENTAKRSLFDLYPIADASVVLLFLSKISLILNSFCPKATGQTGSQVSDTGPLVLR